jgi:alanyl-tRNA synthetase
MGDTGPCGPCSEILIDQGKDIGCKKPECAVGCDCDRFLEIWNLVFMQFNKDEKGELSPLPKPSIDTGMGLERISAVLQGKTSNFDTDLFEPIILDISSLASIPYGSSDQNDTSMRVIADHLRSTVFMLTEGLVPSNEGRGYVLRRIIRRSSRHAKLLNLNDPCLYTLVDSVVKVMGNIYPDIVNEKERTKTLLRIEEENFHLTIETAMDLFDDIIKSARENGSNIIPGAEVARLQQTHGLPLDFAKDIALDAGLVIDEESFHQEMESHRKKSKIVVLKHADGVMKLTVSPVDIKIVNSLDLKTDFVGYDVITSESTVSGILKDDQSVNLLSEGEEGKIVLDRTPFYGESGGQVGEKGTMQSKNARIKVLDTQKPSLDCFIHIVRIEKGKIEKGEKVTCSVDENQRKATKRNHTATHLLHKSLRIFLGEHIKQAGSVVSPERLRFDFTHFHGMSKDEMKDVEHIINEQILENVPVKTDIMTMQEAVNSGAVALFDEKYGETVRVISVGDFSKELCGGIHCNATGEIGLCIILSEGSVASGIRRIEALTGKSARDYLEQQKGNLESIKSILKTENPIEKIEKLQNDLKALEKKVQKLKTGSAGDIISDAIKNSNDLNGVKIVTLQQDGLNQNELRLVADKIRDRLKSGIIIVTSITNGHASIVCMVSKDLTDTYSAGEIIKSIAKASGGKGGGKADMAQGGIKDTSKLDTILSSLPAFIKSTISKQS